MKEYYTILNTSESEFIINRSRFITTACHTETMEDAREFISKIKKQYSDATHNCYGFISDKLGLEMRFSDDGEPQGTAGQPILEVIKKKDLREVTVVVTRYFGGIKLGAGGLVSAYTEGAVSCLDNAKIAKMVLSSVYEVTLDYTTYSVAEKLLREQAIVKDIRYDTDVTITFAVELEDKKVLENLQNITAGRAKPIKIKEEYIDVNN